MKFNEYDIRYGVNAKIIADNNSVNVSQENTTQELSEEIDINDTVMKLSQGDSSVLSELDERGIPFTSKSG